MCLALLAVQTSVALATQNQTAGTGPKKILALHGGNMNAAGFKAMAGIQALMASFPSPEYEFVFAEGGQWRVAAFVWRARRNQP